MSAPALTYGDGISPTSAFSAFSINNSTWKGVSRGTSGVFLKSVFRIAMMWMQRDDCVDGVVDDAIS
jgi:hypothetical protein